jgi:AcrR family transcriptional regulator
MAARGSLANSEATKAALLDAAQELFAAQGIEAVSLRAIQRLASVAPGTLQYHFDSRDELLEALLAREQADLNAKVTGRAARLSTEGGAPDAAAIVDVIAAPYVAFIRADPVRGPRHVKVLAQLASVGDRRSLPPVGALGPLVMELIERAYPGTEAAAAQEAILVAARALLFLLAGQGADAEAEPIVRFVAGGLDALLRKRS